GAGAARGRAVVTGPSAGAGDARSARLLARQLRRGQSRNEGSLPAPPPARQTPLPPADAPRQAALFLVSVRKHFESFESFESFVVQSGDLIREGHHRCGRRRTADVTTAANCDIRVT